MNNIIALLESISKYPKESFFLGVFIIVMVFIIAMTIVEVANIFKKSK
jgi:hypothetical protein